MRQWATLILAILPFVLAGPVRADNIAIVGGTVHTMSPAGVIEGGTVLIEDDEIRAVGTAIAIPENFDVIDATGKIVTPGIVNAYTTLGLVEISLQQSTLDDRLDDTAPFHAAFDVSYGINHNATAIPITRMEGVTRAVVAAVPAGNLFGGFGALIHLGTGPDLLMRNRAFQAVSLGQSGAQRAGGARGGAMGYLIAALEDALSYDEARNKREWEGMLPRRDAAALVAVVNGEIPLLIEAHRASDLLQIIALRQRFRKLDIVLLGGDEGWMVADRLAAAEIPVIVMPFSNLPGNFEHLAATQHNAQRLQEAGVLIAIANTSADGHNPRLITQYAGNAVANGLPWADAMRAITSNPAEIFGVSDQVGTLERGKLADVVVWDGDPLEVSSSPDAVIIGGSSIPLESRQTRLRDRYRDLDTELPFVFK